MTKPIGVTELHLHLEGSLFPRSAIEIARKIRHPWAGETERSLRSRFRYRDFDEFLETIREMCALLSSPGALERVARELSLFLGAHAVLYAEVYVSPLIYMRCGIGYDEVIGAVAGGFSEGEREGGSACTILLDSVRHWGREAAESVLEAAARHPHESVAGFGLGGAETPPLEDFVSVFEAAREIGLRRLVHAGETGTGDDVAKAVELLGVERIAHGIRAVDSATALELLRRKRVPLDLAVTSNYRTRVTAGRHPIRSLIDEGIIVTLSTDDPSLFRTDPIREYRRARRLGDLSVGELFAVAANGIEASFASESKKAELRRELERRRHHHEEAS